MQQPLWAENFSCINALKTTATEELYIELAEDSSSTTARGGTQAFDMAHSVSGADAEQQ